MGSALTSGRKEEAKTAEEETEKRNYHLTTSGFVKKEMKKVVKQAVKNAGSVCHLGEAKSSKICGFML